MSSLRLTAALDPWRRFPIQRKRIVQLGRSQVALKEPAQVIASAVEPELDRTPVDGDLHLRRAGERKADVGPAGGFLGGHLLGFLYWDRWLFDQDRADISESNERSCRAFKDHKVSGIWREVDPFRTRYSDQSAAAGFNQEWAKRLKGNLFVNLFNHTRS
jgi:hypothetical protein